MKKISKIIVIIFCITLIISGCTTGDNEIKEGQYNIYYINKEYTSLIAKKNTIKSTETNKIVDEIIIIIDTYDSDIEYNNAKPNDVKITKYEITDKILNVYFDSSYNNMDNISELLCRAAIVLTFTQIPGLDYVSIYVDGQPLLDSNDKPIGSMKASDFIDQYGDISNLSQTITTVLYLANEKGDKLVPYTYEGEYAKNQSIEQFIIEKLMEGVKGSNLNSTIPEDVELINIISKNGICYVDFKESFLTESLDITDEVAIYSIVNSLCETDYITKVQISVGGQTDKMYHENISLDKKFVRNLDIVDSDDIK